MQIRYVRPEEQAALQAKQWKARHWLEANAMANAMNVKWKRFFHKRRNTVVPLYDRETDQ